MGHSTRTEYGEAFGDEFSWRIERDTTEQDSVETTILGHSVRGRPSPFFPRRDARKALRRLRTDRAVELSGNDRGRKR